MCAFLQMQEQDEDTTLSDVTTRSSALQLERVLLLSKEVRLYNLLQQQQQNDSRGLFSSSSFGFSASAFGTLDACLHAKAFMVVCKLVHHSSNHQS